MKRYTLIGIIILACAVLALTAWNFKQSNTLNDFRSDQQLLVVAVENAQGRMDDISADLAIAQDRMDGFAGDLQAAAMLMADAQDRMDDISADLADALKGKQGPSAHSLAEQKAYEELVRCFESYGKAFDNLKTGYDALSMDYIHMADLQSKLPEVKALMVSGALRNEMILFPWEWEKILKDTESAARELRERLPSYAPDELWQFYAQSNLFAKALRGYFEAVRAAP